MKGSDIIALISLILLALTAMSGLIVWILKVALDNQKRQIKSQVTDMALNSNIQGLISQVSSMQDGLKYLDVLEAKINRIEKTQRYHQSILKEIKPDAFQREED